MKRKGQVWTIDFIAGILIFAVILVIAVSMIMNMARSDSYETVYRDGVYLSDSLISTGQPSNWTLANVIKPGIGEENHRINYTKLSSFDSIPYAQTKGSFHMPSDYVFFFRNSTGVINASGCMHGYPIALTAGCEPDLSTIEYSNLVKIERIVILNSSLAMMVVYTWN